MMDEETRQKLQYALIKVESCMDDPVLEAEMLLKMKKLYENEKVVMPPKINAFYNYEMKRIAIKIKTKIDKLNEKKNGEEKKSWI